MKIIYIHNSLALWGGIERVLIDKMNYLVEKYGYDIYMITTDQGKHEIPYEMDRRIHYIDLNINFHQIYKYSFFQKIIGKYKNRLKFRKLLRSNFDSINPDVIVSTTDNFIDDIIYVKKRTEHYVIESHSTMQHSYINDSVRQSFYKRIIRFLYLKQVIYSSAMVTLTKGDKLEWQKFCDNIFVIPNVVHLNPQRIYSTCNNKRAIFVGRLAKQKGISYLIDIWSLVHKRYPEWILDIFGEGELSMEVYDNINQFDDKLNIHIHRPTKEIFGEYINSSMLLMTSVYEPFGLVIPEAMSCGIPVISFDCDYGPRDIIKDGEDGFLIKPYDINVFAEKIIYLIERSDIRQNMGRNAIVNSQRYSFDNIMPKWKNLFETIALQNNMKTH